MPDHASPRGETPRGVQFCHLRGGDSDNGKHPEEHFAGQVNGLCGTAVPDVIFVITGLHTGYVDFTIDLLDGLPLEDDWEEIVEASFVHEGGKITACTCMNGASFALPLAPGTYRVRYCGRGVDAAHASNVVFEDEPAVDAYALTF